MTTIDLEEVGLRPPEVAQSLGVEPRLGFAARLRVWASVHRRSIVILGALLTGVGLVHAWGVSRAPALTDDEGTYTAEAWAVRVEHHLAPYTYWYDHPPLGWLIISGWTFAVGAVSRSTHAIVEGRHLMVLAAVVSAGLLYVLARRLQMGRATSSAAVVLFGFSPLAVDYQRLVLLDNLAVPWLLASLVLVASPRRNLWAVAAGGACFAVSVLTKETFLLFLPAELVLLWLRSHPKTRSFCFTGFVSTFLLLLVLYPLYAALRGELIPGSGHVSLVQAIQFQLGGRQGSGNVLSATSNAHYTVSNWLHLDSWLLGLGVVCIPVVVFARRLWPVAVGLFVPVAIAMRGGYLPDPFVIGLLPFAALAVGGALDLVAGSPERTTRRSRRWRLVALAVLSTLLIAGLGVPWMKGDRALADGDATAPAWQAETWIEAHVPRRDRLIVDDSLWTDLVEHGYSPHLGAVWFYKLDTTNNLDPSVIRALPRGWREFSYIVSTPIIRSALTEMPHGLIPVRDALASSTVVASFGSGPGVVQVRRIEPGPPAQSPLSVR